jgi:zinc transport system substrate-binding protein
MTHKRPSQIQNRWAFRWILQSILFIFLFSVQSSFAAAPLNVYVVNYPLKYFAERIGANHVKVEFPAPPDIDPAYWNPDLADISAYQKADLIMLNGAGYAKWVGKVSLPRSKVVDTSRKFKDRYITSKDVTTHSHGTEGKHAHESLAFTTWLDLTLAVQQAEAIAKALGRKRPNLREAFQENLKTLEKELLDLDEKIQTIVSRDPAKLFIGSHPVYDYFVRRYGIKMESVHWEPDEVPNDGQWIDLQKLLKAHPAEWMIWEGDPLKDSVEKLKTIGIQNLVFDPCGNAPAKGDFLDVMKQNVENLGKAFEE